MIEFLLGVLLGVVELVGIIVVIQISDWRASAKRNREFRRLGGYAIQQTMVQIGNALLPSIRNAFERMAEAVQAATSASLSLADVLERWSPTRPRRARVVARPNSRLSRKAGR